MTAPETRYVVVDWSNLPRWDLKTARASAFRLAHPDFRPLGDFAEEATEMVRPWEKPEALWPVYGVNNENGVVFSHHQRGNTFNAPYKRIRKDWFFHNPTRANVGSLGRVPDVPDDAITSPEYQVWRVKCELLPAYVEILIQSPYFLEQIACHRVGAVKERLFVQNLLEIPIPVVSPAIQGAIVGGWQKARQAIAAAEQRIREIETETERQFVADLGLRTPTQERAPKVLTVMWTDIARWGVDVIRDALARPTFVGTNFPVVRLSDVIPDLENGWSPKCHPRPATDLEWGVLKLGAVSFGVFNPSENKALPAGFAPRLDCEVQTGDVLISRANIARLVGACALVEKTRPRLLLCDKIFRVIWRKTETVDRRFLAEVLKIPHVRRQIESKVTGTSPTMKNITKPNLLALEVPLPPLDVQRRIMETVAADRSRIACERESARAIARQIELDLEGYLLGAKKVKGT